MCKAKEARIALCNEKVSLPPRTDMLVPPRFWAGLFLWSAALGTGLFCHEGTIYPRTDL